MARFINGFFGEAVPADQRLTITVILGRQDYVFPAKALWDDSLEFPEALWGDKSAQISFPRRLGPIPENVFVRVDSMQFITPGFRMPFKGVTANMDLAIRPGSASETAAPTSQPPASFPVSQLPAAFMPRSLIDQQIPDAAIVAEPAPSSATAPVAVQQPVQRAPGTRITVSKEWADQLLARWPGYFNFPEYRQGSVSTSAAIESTTVDRTGIGGREVRTIEDMRAEATLQKVAAYCVQQAPEGGASTGAMVPVDANCNCPEGFSRVGECPKPKSDSSKWWLALLAGAGVYYWYKRR